MDIFSKLREVVQTSKGSAQSNVVSGTQKNASMPDKKVTDGDDIEPVLDGIRLKILYVDGDGQNSVRVITCKRIVDSEEGARLLAFCHRQHIDRPFLLTRISGAMDTASGGGIENIQSFFAPFLSDSRAEMTSDLSATRNALVAIGDELRILAFMARADQILQDEEDGLISHFVRHRAEELGHDVSAHYDHQRVMDWFRHQVPDINVLERSVRRLAQRSEVNLQRVWKIAAKVMEADGEVTVEELDRLHELSTAVDFALSELKTRNLG